MVRLIYTAFVVPLYLVGLSVLLVCLVGYEITGVFKENKVSSFFLFSATIIALALGFAVTNGKSLLEWLLYE